MRSLLFSLILIATTVTAQQKWNRVDHELYYFEVPSYMVQDTELNEQASSQYSFLQTRGKKTLESYVIVLSETKEEIESYQLSQRFTALSYWHLSAENIGEGLSSYRVLTKKPSIVLHNSMYLTTGKIKGKFGKIGVVYELAVYEGKKAFYQVLTWTLTNQYKYFAEDMHKIILSFNEK